MPTPTYTALATVTLDTARPSVIFNNIPATYRDLVVVVSQGLSSSNGVALRFNTDESVSSYRRQIMVGNGSTATASVQTTSYIGIQGSLFTANGGYQIQILDYAATDKSKTVIGRYSNAGTDASMLSGRWVSTAAINRVILTFFGVNATVGSTFSLYGIVA
jgi:hypothetical protein